MNNFFTHEGLMRLGRTISLQQASERVNRLRTELELDFKYANMRTSINSDRLNKQELDMLEFNK